MNLGSIKLMLDTDLCIHSWGPVHFHFFSFSPCTLHTRRKGEKLNLRAEKGFLDLHVATLRLSTTTGLSTPFPIDLQTCVKLYVRKRPMFRKTCIDYPFLAQTTFFVFYNEPRFRRPRHWKMGVYSEKCGYQQVFPNLLDFER